MRKYGPYENMKNGYLFHIYIDSKGNKKSVLVHREIMEEHLNRKLSSKEIVHHKDGNIRNNKISNLKITDRSKHASYHAPEAEYIEITCLECGKKSMRYAAQQRHAINQGKKGTFCNRSCSGKWIRRKQIENGQINLRSERVQTGKGG